MKHRIPYALTALALAGLLNVAPAATIIVNTADNADFGVGRINLVRALTNANNGDTIAFNIPGAGPHYLESPAEGFPLVIRDNVTIDGYSQPGSLANTNPITASNSAVIKIVLDSRNGSYRDMRYNLFTPANSSPPIDNTAMETERAGYTDTERATLGIYRATNVNIRGLAFLGSLESSAYGIAVAHDYGGDTTVKDRLAYNEGSSRDCHINGCWFGINPTNRTEAGLARFAAAIAFFRHREASPPVVPAARPELPNESLIVGVKAGSANPRAEFNVFAYNGYALAGEAVRTRFSGNFLGVFPDGVTPTPIAVGGFSSGAEVGRYDDTLPIVIGTDGDGTNDWDEGNLLGPLLDGGTVFDFYSTGNKQYLVSGNRFGMGVDGTRWTNSQAVFAGFGGTTRVQFGSDLNGVSDAAEANVVYNNHPFAEVFPDPTNPLAPLAPRVLGLSAGTRVSFRGNSLVNNALAPFDYAAGNGSQLTPFTNYSAPYLNVDGPIIPSLSGASSAASIIGTCAAGTNAYTNIFIDVYLADAEGIASGRAFELQELMVDGVTNGFPQGKTYLGTFKDNGPGDSDPAVGAFNLNAASLGIPSGALVTVTANYSSDSAGAARGSTHTSDFANPVSLGLPPGVIFVTSTDSASPNGFSAALLNVQAGGEIRFNIPGAGPHYLESPAEGFPLVIRDNVTIDGYSQPGSLANTNPITASNSAVIKIVLDSRNGSYRDMRYNLFTPANSSPPIDNTAMETERAGYTDTERATLGIYRATNVNIRGLAFLGSLESSAYGIAVAHDYGGDTTVKDRLAYNEGSSRDCHINGCWFGINPTNRTEAGLARFAAAIAFFRHREASPPVVPAARPELPNESLIVGVKAGSANPRAEFNVFAYNGYALAGEAVRTRFSGNFLGVFPDGVTPTPIAVGGFSSGAEVGRYDDTLPIVIGTDGDGTNDWDEGNLLGPLLDGGTVFDFYSTGNKQYLVSGNRFGMGVDGTRWTNSQAVFAGFGGTTRVQFGSDLNGVSDAAEANVVYNNHPFAEVFPDPTNPLAPLAPRVLGLSAGTRVSFRGNSLVNNALAPFDYAAGNGSQLTPFTNYSAPYLNVDGPIIPSLSGASSAASIIGTCAAGTNAYTNIFIDVYLADAEGIASGRAFELQELMVDGVTNGFPQGKTYLGTFKDNGPGDSDPAVGAFNLNAASLGIPSGALVTVTANYSSDSAGAARGSTHTSDFANPVTLISSLAITSVTKTGNTLTITWAGGSAPYSLLKKSTITGAWSTVASGLTGPSTTDTITSTNAFYRISSP